MCRLLPGFACALTWIAVLLVAPPQHVAADGAAEAGAKMFDPRFREGAPSDPLVVGPPRLSRGHLNAFVDIFEAAFELSFSAHDEQALRDALEEEFDTSKSADRESFLDLVDSIVDRRATARCCVWRAVHDGLRRFRGAIDRRFRTAAKEPANVIMARVLRRRHEIVWGGEPAVKGMAVDVYLEAVLFLTSIARNEEVTLTDGQRTALIDYLGRDLRRCDECVRECLVSFHKRWLLAKARWDRGPDSRRLALRFEAVTLLARLAPVKGGIKIKRGTDDKAYAREASKIAAADRPFDAVTALARNPQALFQSLCRGLQLPRNAPSFSFLYR